MSKPTKATKRAVRYPTATGNAVLRAYNRAAKTINDEAVMSTAHSAGHIVLPNMPKGENYQVFVKIIRYSESFKDSYPVTGGLLDQL
jgi:hypothetical protein